MTVLSLYYRALSQSGKKKRNISRAQLIFLTFSTLHFGQTFSCVATAAAVGKTQQMEFSRQPTLAGIFKRCNCTMQE
jgi:hypothetical protein